MELIQKMMINSNNYKLTHEIKENENEYIVNVKMKMPKNKYGYDMIKKCFEEQKSPITQILGKKEKEIIRDIKHEESVILLYQKE